MNKVAVTNSLSKKKRDRFANRDIETFSKKSVKSNVAISDKKKMKMF